jgi:predicted small secreted protein
MATRLLASLLATLSLVGALSTLAGCAAVEATGSTIERGGQKIQDEAREHK